MSTAPPAKHERDRLADLDAFQLINRPGNWRLDLVTQTAHTLFNVPIALISLVTENKQCFVSRQGLLATETARSESFCAHALDLSGALVVEDALQDERFRSNPLVVGDIGIRFYAGYPLRLRAESAVGTLCIIDTEPRTFAPGDEEILRALAIWASAELKHVRHDPVHMALSDMPDTLAGSVALDANTGLITIQGLQYLLDRRGAGPAPAAEDRLQFHLLEVTCETQLPTAGDTSNDFLMDWLEMKLARGLRIAVADGGIVARLDRLRYVVVCSAAQTPDMGLAVSQWAGSAAAEALLNDERLTFVSSGPLPAPEWETVRAASLLSATEDMWAAARFSVIPVPPQRQA